MLYNSNYFKKKMENEKKWSQIPHFFSITNHVSAIVCQWFSAIVLCVIKDNSKFESNSQA